MGFGAKNETYILKKCIYRVTVYIYKFLLIFFQAQHFGDALLTSNEIFEENY